jgi:hypothetical protein
VLTLHLCVSFRNARSPLPNFDPVLPYIFFTSSLVLITLYDPLVLPQSLREDSPEWGATLGHRLVALQGTLDILMSLLYTLVVFT